jgi:hypothetical protein
MVKRTATIVVLLFTVALPSFGNPIGDHIGDPIGDRQHHRPCEVPEPGSLLVFGTGLLLSFRSLRRKL